MYNSFVASKLYSYFITKGGLKETPKGWLVGDCPHCGKENKFGVHVETNRSNCFVCLQKTKLLPLVKVMEGFDTFSQVYNLLNNYDSFKLKVQRADRPKKIVKPFVNNLPPEYRLVGLVDTRMDKLVRSKLKARGIGLTRAMLLGIGYCLKGTYSARIIIPFYRDGDIVYFNAWSMVATGAKYTNPDEDTLGRGKGQVIYNHDALYTYNKVWMFEGVFNALTIGLTATATGGKQITQWQLNEYNSSPCKAVVIAWDSDAYLEAIQVAMKIVHTKRVKVLKFPPGKDANDIGKQATKEIEKNTPYMNYKELYKLYLDEKRAEHTR